MPVYKLIKDGAIVNTIVANEIESIQSEYDQIEEVVLAAEEPAPATQIWTQDNVRSGLTLAEKTVWDNNSAPEVVTAKIEIGGGLEEAAITEVLDFLIAADVISADSKTAVLA